MSMPTVVLSWDFTKINQRETYTSVNDATGFTFFTMWRYWIDVLGWTIKYTCDGTTGPTSSSDHTDRLTTKAKCVTRGASTTAVQSFGVATDGNGADHLLAYVGSGTSPTGDDLFYMAYSPTGVYLPAGTSTNTPTATDQVLVQNSLTLVGTGANDRLIQMQGSTDKKNFRLWVYSNGVMQREYFIERGTSSVQSALNWTDPLVVGQNTAISGSSSFSGTGGPISNPSGSSQGSTGNAYAKIAGQIVAVGGGGELYLGSTRMGQGVNCFTTANPELNGGGPIVPTVFASSTTFTQGKLANRIDSWFPFVNGITDNTWFGSNYNYMYANSRVVPWDGVNPMIIA